MKSGMFWYKDGTYFGSGIKDEFAAPHLFQCASDVLGDVLIKVKALI